MAAISNGMWTVKLCSNKILQFLTGGAGHKTDIIVVVVMLDMIKFNFLKYENTCQIISVCKFPPSNWK